MMKKNLPKHNRIHKSVIQTSTELELVNQPTYYTFDGISRIV